MRALPSKSVLQELKQLGIHVPLLACRIAHQVSTQKEMAEQPAGHRGLGRERIVVKLDHPAEVVQDGARHDEVAIERRRRSG